MLLTGGGNTSSRGGSWDVETETLSDGRLGSAALRLDETEVTPPAVTSLCDSWLAARGFLTVHFVFKNGRSASTTVSLFHQLDTEKTCQVKDDASEVMSLGSRDVQHPTTPSQKTLTQDQTEATICCDVINECDQ